MSEAQRIVLVVFALAIALLLIVFLAWAAHLSSGQIGTHKSSYLVTNATATVCWRTYQAIPKNEGLSFKDLRVQPSTGE